MIKPEFLYEIILTTLKHAPFPFPQRAASLLLGTAIQESKLIYFRQLGGGPARGLWQMEPITAIDHFRWMKLRPTILKWFLETTGVKEYNQFHLEFNILYGLCLARIHYYVRDPNTIPEEIAEQAKRWKKYYNTLSGKGKIEDYLASWNAYVDPFTLNS